jgi:hypothetical protein
MDAVSESQVDHGDQWRTPTNEGFIHSGQTGVPENLFYCGTG